MTQTFRDGTLVRSAERCAAARKLAKLGNGVAQIAEDSVSQRARFIAHSRRVEVPTCPLYLRLYGDPNEKCPMCQRLYGSVAQFG